MYVGLHIPYEYGYSMDIENLYEYTKYKHWRNQDFYTNGQDFYSWAKNILVQQSTNNVIKTRKKMKSGFLLT